MTEFAMKIHRGQPIDDMEIIDLHAHLGPYFNMHVPMVSADDMIVSMDRLGIDKVVASATPGIYSDLIMGNDLTLEAIRKYPGRFYGACLVNGNFPGLSMDELHRCFDDEDGFVLIKVHPVLAHCKMDAPEMRKIYEYASENRLFVLVHTWYEGDPFGSQDQFAAMAREYPDALWIMGHSGGPFGSRYAVEIAEELPNVFLDLTLSMCPAQQIEEFVRCIGSERVVFGTDNPFIDPRPALGRVFLADIERNDLENIVSGNAKRYIAFD